MDIRQDGAKGDGAVKQVREEPVLMESGLAGLALGISDERVRQLVKNGRLKARRTARGRLLFEPAEVERLRVERALKKAASS